MWNPPGQARTMVNPTRIRHSDTWQTFRGLPTPSPILKITRQFKKWVFFNFLKKRKEEKGEKETMEDRTQNERQLSPASWNEKLLSRDFIKT